MTPEQFFANFAHLADAPNGVQKLRELILQLAVQGKLVPQDPTDEPAATLLERIQGEKAKLVKEKKIRKADPLPPVSADETPYELPQGWEWVRAQDIMCSITDGDHLPPPKAATGVPFLVIGNVRTGIIDYSDSRFVTNDYFQAVDESRKPRKGDLLYTLVGSYGIPVLVDSDIEFCVQRHIGILKPSIHVDVKFLVHLYGASFIFDQATKYATGIAQKTVPLSGLRKFVIPLPPLAEQHRLVAKVDQLMALCDELEAKQQKQRQKLTRLNNAAIDRLLTAREQADFADSWGLIRDNFDLLYTTPDNIAKLRQAILQLAVQGKLVPQDPTDEPASVLLAKIKAEKERLVKEKKIRKAAPLPPVNADEAPYELPQGWVWERLGKVILKLTDGTHHSPANFSSGDFKYVTAKNIKNEGIILGDITYVNSKVHDEIYSRCNPELGDILYIKDGATTGIATINQLAEPFSMLSSVALLKLPIGISNRFMLYLLRSPYFYDLMREGMTGVAITRVTLSKLGNAIIPLPPTDEQHRIVAKVDQLMALCDALETRLTKAHGKSEKLTASAVQSLLAA